MACLLSAAECFRKRVAAKSDITERGQGWWSMTLPDRPPRAAAPVPRRHRSVHITYADLGKCPQSETYKWLVRQGHPGRVPRKAEGLAAVERSPRVRQRRREACGSHPRRSVRRGDHDRAADPRRRAGARRRGPRRCRVRRAGRPARPQAPDHLPSNCGAAPQGPGLVPVPSGNACPLRGKVATQWYQTACQSCQIPQVRGGCPIACRCSRVHVRAIRAAPVVHVRAMPHSGHQDDPSPCCPAARSFSSAVRAASCDVRCHHSPHLYTRILCPGYKDRAPFFADAFDAYALFPQSGQVATGRSWLVWDRRAMSAR